jgi:hypothetical protein
MLLTSVSIPGYGADYYLAEECNSIYILVTAVDIRVTTIVRTMKKYVLARTALMVAVAMVSIMLSVPEEADAGPAKQIRMRIRDRSVTATLNDSSASRHFALMLPLILHMSDLLEREKVAPLPEPLSVSASAGVPRYAVGEIGYWEPDGHFVVYYRDDGSQLPPPGIVPLGNIDSGYEIFNVPGDVDVAIEVIN